MTDDRTVTTVEIAGDTYTIRSEASQEYTQECARYVNRTLEQIMARGSLVEVHKAAILAAMALTDELFQARAEADAARAALAERATRLLSEIDDALPSPGLASAE